MRFQITAMDPRGSRTTFSREATTAEALSAQLRAEGFVVVALTPDAAAAPDSAAREPDRTLPRYHPAWLKPMTNFDVEMGLRQIASMIGSGVTLLFALQTVQEQAASPRAARAWGRVAEKIRAGRSFAEALADDVKRFGEITVRLAEVGERAGELQRTMTRAADQMEARRNLRTTVVNALVYPVLAVALAIGVSAYLVTMVIPKIADFLKSGGVALPGLTQLLMDFADWVNANGLTILAGAVAAVAAWIVVRLNAHGRELEDVFLLKIPVTGRILRLSATALFARSMQIMTESGVTLLDALATSARLLGNRRCRRRVAAAHDAVMRGASLERALAPAREFLPMLRRMAAVGEVTGALPESFGETARFHEMLLAIAVKRFGMMIEPVMIVITGIIVGFVYVAFFMALFAIAGAA